MAGLSRPSTPFLLKTRKKDVDARDERGHDGGEVIDLIEARSQGVLMAPNALRIAAAPKGIH
jgi:hypothetical protein